MSKLTNSIDNFKPSSDSNAFEYSIQELDSQINCRIIGDVMFENAQKFYDILSGLNSEKKIVVDFVDTSYISGPSSLGLSVFVEKMINDNRKIFLNNPPEVLKLFLQKKCNTEEIFQDDNFISQENMHTENIMNTKTGPLEQTQKLDEDTKEYSFVDALKNTKKIFALLEKGKQVKINVHGGENVCPKRLKDFIILCSKEFESFIEAKKNIIFTETPSQWMEYFTSLGFSAEENELA